MFEMKELICDKRCLNINSLLVVMICLLIKSVSAIQYQWGILNYIKYPVTPLHILADTHNAGAWSSQTRTLTGFVEEPQIIISLLRMHFENTIPGGYLVQIDSQSSTQFKIFINSTSPQKIYNVHIKYLAFVDKNKQVIQQEILDPEAIEVFPEQHFNKNFVLAVPIINYICYTSAFTFKFDLPIVDSSSVQMTLTSTGISQIGFQILISIQSPIYLYGITQWAPSFSTIDLSPFIISNNQIPILYQSNIIRFPLYLGLTSDLTAEVNIEDFDQPISTQLSFQIGSSIPSSVTGGWFGYMLLQPNFEVQPLLLKSFSQDEYFEGSGTQLITVELPIFQYIYTSSTDWIEIDNTAIGLQIEITAECLLNQKHDYWFLGSLSNHQKYIQDYFYCSAENNRVKYIINLTDGGRLEHKTIKFVFTATSVEMYQQLDNVKFDEEYRNLKIVITKIR